MKTIKAFTQVLALCSLFLILFSCKKEELPEFKLVRQTIAEGEVVDSLLSNITFVYSQPITLLDASKIRLTECSVESEVAGATLRMEISGLRGESQYTLTIGKGALEDRNGQQLEDFAVTFNTSGEREIIIQLATQKALGTASLPALKQYKFLRDNYGLKTLSATMSYVSFNTNEAQWVHKHTGKWPAMNCFDFIHLGENYANYYNLDDFQDWYDNNGMVLAMWHWRVPVSEGNSAKEFYKQNNNFNVANATVAGTWENDFLEQDILKLIEVLQQFKDRNIPIIWRPFHEAAGGWFWWGAGTGEDFVKLWRWMFQKLVVEAKLNNLIWVWTTERNDDSWYPGDDYVDIIGRDIYNENSGSQLTAQFAEIQRKYPNRIVALSECGSVATIPTQWMAGARWMYFMPWYDAGRTSSVVSNEFNSTNHQHADITWWNAAFGNRYVLTRDDLPSWK